MKILRKYQKLCAEDPRFVFFAFGLLMLASELWKQYLLTFPLGGGAYNWWYFPFQLCSIPMYVCLLFGLAKTKAFRELLAAFLMDFGLLGGIFAFFDTSGMQYPIAALTVHSYVWHLLLILLSFLAVRFYPGAGSWRNYARSCLLYLSCCCAAALLNVRLDSLGRINMFYINPHYRMSQRVFSRIAGEIGNTPGIFFYIVSCMAGAALLHALLRILSRRLFCFHPPES